MLEMRKALSQMVIETREQEKRRHTHEINMLMKQYDISFSDIIKVSKKTESCDHTFDPYMGKCTRCSQPSTYGDYLMELLKSRQSQCGHLFERQDLIYTCTKCGLSGGAKLIEDLAPECDHDFTKIGWDWRCKKCGGYDD